MNDQTSIFDKESTFNVAPFLFALATVVYFACLIIQKTFIPLSGTIDILCAIMVFIIFFSYKKHEKNLMKGLLGSLLMARLIFSFSVLYHFMSMEGKSNEVLCGIIYVGCYLLLIVFHFVLGIGHAAKPTVVKVNQLCCVLCCLVSGILQCSMVGDLGWPIVISGVVQEATIIIEIICIETKVDAFKVKRQENGYDPEAHK